MAANDPERPRQQRASMKEGPLAELFRRTTDDPPVPPGTQPSLRPLRPLRLLNLRRSLRRLLRRPRLLSRRLRATQVNADLRCVPPLTIEFSPSPRCRGGWLVNH